MQVIKSEQLIPVDVDDTLLLWNHEDTAASIYVHFEDPYENRMKMVQIHQPHIKVLKDRLARGATVILWSASGWQWAEAAAKCLELSGDNLIIASKPIFYMDDKPAEFWMGEPMFMKPTDKWGNGR